jgi:hypothetical protein
MEPAKTTAGNLRTETRETQNEHCMAKYMKTIKINDEIHRKLTITLGTLMAQTGKPQTYQDALEALITQSVKLPEETLKEVENFVIENKHLGYTTKEEFIRQAIRFYLKWKAKEYEYMKSQKKNMTG